MIANELGIAVGTAKLHVAAVMAALGVHFRAQAALAAQAQLGGLTLEEIAWCHAHAAEVRALMAARAPDRGMTAACAGDG